MIIASLGKEADAGMSLLGIETAISKQVSSNKDASEGRDEFKSAERH